MSSRAGAVNPAPKRPACAAAWLGTLEHLLKADRSHSCEADDSESTQ